MTVLEDKARYALLEALVIINSNFRKRPEKRIDWRKKMRIIYQEETKIFHLCNDAVSYIMMVLPNGHLGQLYFGRRVNTDKDYSYLLEMMSRPMASYL